MPGLEEAAGDWLSGLVKSDPGVQSIMGPDPKIRWLWAQTDEEFPYMVFSLHLMADPDIAFMYQGTIVLDIWWHGPTGRRATQLRDVLVPLLWQNYYGYQGEGFRDPRVWFTGDGPVPQEDPRIWRTTLQFGIRLTATGDALGALARA